jgi:hypothetical protein
MKKGLLSILASALLVVGCQNYDDQFSALETQINALASTVAGLTQVQSDLASLANTVNSLQSSVAQTVDAALADGLADIDAAVASLEAAAADAASAEDVAAIQAGVDANADDLDELLAQSSVFSGDVLINSVPTLDAYYSMGENLAIVNGNVTIQPTAEMDMVKVQAVADVILTITKDLTVTSAASTIPELVFNNLSGVATLTMEQAGGYHFPLLKSAASINLSDKFESTVVRVNFPALTSVNSMGTDSNNNNVIEFTKATEMSFAALPRYAPNAIFFRTKKGKADAATTLDISALKDVDSAGEIAGLALQIQGPNSVTISTLDGKSGTVSLTDVLSATITDYDGTITVGDGVETFTSNNVVAINGSMKDIITLDIKGVIDPNTATDKSGPAISLASLADLTTATLDGNYASIDVTSCNNIETLTLKSTTDVNNGDINLDGNSDLEVINFAKAKTSGVILNNNNSLVTANVDVTIQKTLATAATLDGSIVVTNNSDLESLTISAGSVAVLTITGNADLESINGTGLTSIGATAASNNITITGNKLVASIAQDKTNAAACTSCANLEANDLGGFTTASGMSTMKAYLALVAANTAATASVYWDTVESTTSATGVETVAETTTQGDVTVILALTAEVATAAKSDIAARRAFILDVSVVSTAYGMEFVGTTDDGDNVGLFSNGTSASTAGSITRSTNLDLLIADIKAQANIDRAAAYGVALEAARGGNSTGTVSLILHTAGTNTTVTGQRYVTETALTAAVSTTNHGVGTDDSITLTLGGNSITISGTAYTSASGQAGATQLGDDLVTGWNAKYGNTGTASGSALASLANTAGVLTFTMLDVGTAGYNVNMDVSVSAGTVTATNAASLDWMVGATKLESDDATVDTDVVVTFASTTAGTLANSVGVIGTTVSAARATNGSGLKSSSTAGAPWIELFTTKVTNSTDTTAPYTAAGQSANVVNAEDGSPKVVSTAAQSKTRVHWL